MFCFDPARQSRQLIIEARYFPPPFSWNGYLDYIDTLSHTRHSSRSGYKQGTNEGGLTEHRHFNIWTSVYHLLQHINLVRVTVVVQVRSTNILRAICVGRLIRVANSTCDAVEERQAVKVIISRYRYGVGQARNTNNTRFTVGGYFSTSLAAVAIRPLVQFFAPRTNTNVWSTREENFKVFARKSDHKWRATSLVAMVQYAKEWCIVQK